MNIVKMILSLPPVSKSSSYTPPPPNLSKLESALSSLRKSYPTILIQKNSEDLYLNLTVFPNSPESRGRCSLGSISKTHPTLFHIIPIGIYGFLEFL
jgi:hypothetical protein